MEKNKEKRKIRVARTFMKMYCIVSPIFIISRKRLNKLLLLGLHSVNLGCSFRNWGRLGMWDYKGMFGSVMG